MSNRTAAVAVPALLLLAILGGPVAAQDPTPTPSQPAQVQRLAGPTRLETAISLSQNTFGPGDAPVVVLARSDEFADALAGAPLAAKERGPILLTPPDGLVDITAAEIQRVLPPGGVVYLLGGPAALSERVAQDVAALGYTPQRLQGPSRYETAIAIADAASTRPQFITIATGNAFGDALIAGSLAAASADGVTVLTNGPSLPASVGRYLQDHADVLKTTIGPDAHEAVPEPKPFNVSGADVFARSVVTAETFYGVDDPDTAPRGVAIASGEAFPDGLAGGAHTFLAGRLPLLLTRQDQISDAALSYIAQIPSPQRAYLYGGDAAVSGAVEQQVNQALAS